MDFPKLLHSVSYSGTWDQAKLTLDEFVDKAADLGFEGVMLMAKRPHLSVLDYGDKQTTQLREHLERRNIRHICIAGYNNFTADLEHDDIPHREMQIDHIHRLARVARDLGAKVVRIFTGYEHAASNYAAQWNLIVAAIKECARRANELGVIIGVQNHHDIAAGYECQRDLIEAVDEPNCKALFDAWAPALQGVDLEAAARVMGPITVHTTIANYQRRPRYRYEPAVVNYTEVTPYVQAVPMEEGFIDYKRFLEAMSRSGFQGSVAYEMCSPLMGGGSVENLDCYAKKFLEWAGGNACPTSLPSSRL